MARGFYIEGQHGIRIPQTGQFVTQCARADTEFLSRLDPTPGAFKRGPYQMLLTVHNRGLQRFG